MIKNKRKRIKIIYLKKILLTSIFTVSSLFILFPLIWLFFTSFKPKIETFNMPPTIFPEAPTLDNYIYLFNNSNFLIYFRNSFFISIISASLAVVIGVIGVYSLSRFRTKYTGIISLLLVIMYMLPEIIIVIPFLKFFFAVNMGDSLISLTVIYISLTVPFAVWMLKSYIDSVPIEIEEASMVDGTTRFGAFLKVVLPTTIPGLMATFIFTFILAWNEYVYSLVLITSDNRRTLTVGIANLMGGDAIYSWGVLSAASILVIIPILIIFMLLQKHLVSGFTAGAVKG